MRTEELVYLQAVSAKGNDIKGNTAVMNTVHRTYYYYYLFYKEESLR